MLASTHCRYCLYLKHLLLYQDNVLQQLNQQGTAPASSLFESEIRTRTRGLLPLYFDTTPRAAPVLQLNIHLYTFPDKNLPKIESGARRLLYCRHLLVIRARVGNNNDGGLLVYKYFWRSVGIFFSDKNLGRLAVV